MRDRLSWAATSHMLSQVQTWDVTQISVIVHEINKELLQWGEWHAMSGNIWIRRQFDYFIELIDVSLLILHEHNFITDVRKGGDFLKSYWEK